MPTARYSQQVMMKNEQVGIDVERVSAVVKVANLFQVKPLADGELLPGDNPAVIGDVVIHVAVLKLAYCGLVGFGEIIASLMEGRVDFYRRQGLGVKGSVFIEYMPGQVIPVKVFHFVEEHGLRHSSGAAGGDGVGQHRTPFGGRFTAAVSRSEL